MAKEVVIIDLDGTLANVGPVRHWVKNKPRNFEKFHMYASTDAAVNEQVRFIIEAAYEDVIVVTGRHEKWRTATEAWFEKNSLRVDEMFMRPDDDFSKDVVLKRRIYEESIFLYYKVVLAVDDNPSIVALWRELGIPTLVVPGWDDPL